MTREDFNEKKYGAGMKIRIPNGDMMPLLGVDFDLYMFGVANVDPSDELVWYNCEECTLVEFKTSIF